MSVQTPSQPTVNRSSRRRVVALVAGLGTVLAVGAYSLGAVSNDATAVRFDREAGTGVGAGVQAAGNAAGGYGRGGGGVGAGGTGGVGNGAGDPLGIMLSMIKR